MTKKHKGLPIRGFTSDAVWEAWLDKEHESADGLWVKFAKKGSGKRSVTYEQARDTALAFGWIDGLINALDETYYAVRFTPRRPKSKWSVVNVRIIERLVQEGRMRPAGLAQVEAAKADGRWEAAYPPQSEMEPPDDLLAALDAAPGARATFEGASRANRFAILYQLLEAKRPETRARRLEKFVALLARGDVPYPGR